MNKKEMEDEALSNFLDKINDAISLVRILEHDLGTGNLDSSKRLARKIKICLNEGINYIVDIEYD